ncbi:protein LNK1 isoform X1 [Populus alba x Populus x berolinensis]|nr:protein LNK1 isoform X1 [Populus alba x Populus x berolinensis]
MSDLCMYECVSNILWQLEDNPWDEFSVSDDHIVPHPGHEYGDRFVAQGVKQKKPESKIISVVNNEDDSLTYSTQEEEEASLPTLVKKDTMLEKDSWSNTPDGVFPTSRDSGTVKDFITIRSEETSMPSHCLKSGNIDSVGSEFCASDPTSDEKCSAVDNNLYSYPLSHISKTDNDLSFFDNECEDKESSDPLYYGWPDDIGNFEDVDRMFRSCDSTFGLGSLSNEDDLCWFSSSDFTERSDDALNLGSKFLNSEASALDSVSEHPEASQLSCDDPSVYDSNKKSIFTDDKISSRTSSAVDHSSLGYLTFLNGSETKSASMDDLVLKEKMSWNKRQARHNNRFEGRRKDSDIENGSFPLNVNMKHFADTKHSSGDSSHQVLPLPGIQQHKQIIGSNSLNYMQKHIPLIHIDYSHSSDQISTCPTQSNVKSENNGYPSPSPKESSIASNHVRSIESANGPDFEAPAITTNENEENLYHCQEPSSGRNLRPANMVGPVEFYGPVSAKKVARQSEYDIKGVGTGIPAKLDSSNAQESSCMSSVLDGISLEAASFRQLQQVMEQLDIRTKLCIRDSLYRLARSAEQRHNHRNGSGGKRDDADRSGALMAEEADKTGLMDMETDTNPIDRSIAHLLFHRPSDPSLMPAIDSSSLKSHTMIHGSISSLPVMTKEHCQEETATGVDGSLLMSNDKQ